MLEILVIVLLYAVFLLLLKTSQKKRKMNQIKWMKQKPQRIPEYELSKSIMPEYGAIYHVDENGKEELFAIYDSDNEYFVKPK